MLGAAAPALPQTRHDSSQTDGFSPRGPILLKLGCNFPLRMVNGLHLYRAVIPKALHGASHATTTCCRTPAQAVTSRPAPPSELLSPYIYTHKQRNRLKKKTISLRKVPHYGFTLLRHWHFISVRLRHGHPALHLFSSPSSCFCLPSTQSSPLSCTSVSFSSLLFLSLLLDP